MMLIFFCLGSIIYLLQFLIPIALTQISSAICSLLIKRESCFKMSRSRKYTWQKIHMFCVIKPSRSSEIVLRVTAIIRLVVYPHLRWIRRPAPPSVNTPNKKWMPKRACGQGRLMRWRQMKDFIPLSRGRCLGSRAWMKLVNHLLCQVARVFMN